MGLIIALFNRVIITPVTHVRPFVGAITYNPITGEGPTCKAVEKILPHLHKFFSSHLSFFHCKLRGLAGDFRGNLTLVWQHVVKHVPLKLDDRLDYLDMISVAIEQADMFFLVLLVLCIDGGLYSMYFLKNHATSGIMNTETLITSMCAIQCKSLALKCS